VPESKEEKISRRFRLVQIAPLHCAKKVRKSSGGKDVQPHFGRGGDRPMTETVKKAMGVPKMKKGLFFLGKKRRSSSTIRSWGDRGNQKKRKTNLSLHKPKKLPRGRS